MVKVPSTITPAFDGPVIDVAHLGGVLSPDQGGTGVTSLSALKSGLNLNLVDNTSDADKPVSTAQSDAISTATSLNLTQLNTAVDQVEEARDLALIFGNSIVKETYSGAVAMGVLADATPVMVLSTDTGNHTSIAGDVGSSGGNTPNSGYFEYSVSLSALVRKRSIPTEINPSKITITKGSTITIASDAVAISGSMLFAIDTEASAASDNLVNITGGTDGQLLGIRSTSSARVIVVKGSGNIKVPHDITLSNTGQMLWLYYDASLSGWIVVSSPTSLTGSGTYTPTVTTISNCEETPIVNGVMYTRIGNLVTVTGTVTLNTTATGDTQFKVTLPIASNLINSYDLSGQAVAYSASAMSGGGIIGTPGDDMAIFRINANTTNIRDYTFSFTYVIK